MIIGERRIQLGGHELLLRCAREEDAQRLLDYLKTTSGETRFLTSVPKGFDGVFQAFHRRPSEIVMGARPVKDRKSVV